MRQVIKASDINAIDGEVRIHLKDDSVVVLRKGLEKLFDTDVEIEYPQVTCSVSDSL